MRFVLLWNRVLAGALLFLHRRLAALGGAPRSSGREAPTPSHCPAEKSKACGSPGVAAVLQLCEDTGDG